MVLNISFNPGTEAKLREQARISGKAVERIVVEAVEARFGQADSPTLSVEERLRLFNEWVASHPRREGVHLDDSRESMYGDDG
jgi:hypothetical protein